MNIAPISEPNTMMPGAGGHPERCAGRRPGGRRAGSRPPLADARTRSPRRPRSPPSPSASAPLFGHGREVDRQDRAPRPAPPTGCRRGCRPGRSSRSRGRARSGHASTSATAASGSVIRKTEPHQKCSSSDAGDQRAERGDRAAERRPQRDRLRPRRPGPQRGDQRERRRVGHAGGEAAEEPGDEQHLDRSARTRRAGTPGSTAPTPRISISLRP